MARKFLYIIVGLIVLTLAAAFAYRIWGAELMRMALVPTARFHREAPVPNDMYDNRKMWLARPDLPDNPALWTPTGYQPGPKGQSAAIFFIHPTSYLSRSRWNAPIDDPEAEARAALFLRGQASAFNNSGEIWAPRYRQATFGAFLTRSDDARRALDLAYGDVSAAFDAFLRQIGPDRPIILAGHSQGSLHLTRLLVDRVAKDPELARRIVAAYVVGWPVSRTTDLPVMGLRECRLADDTHCILSWESFAEPADTSLIVESYDQSQGFDGRPRRDTPVICTNPLTGTAGGSAAPSANLGTLYPSSDLLTAAIRPGQVGAKCTDAGYLSIGEGPDVGPYVLPGNNYHVYDYSLFWANVRADAARRLAAYLGK